MSLEDLKNLERESSHCAGESQNCERARALLASMRSGPHSLSDALEKVASHWRYSSDQLAKEALCAVVNEMAADIYRVAEMRLAAAARFHKVRAAQKQAIVTASILPIPELDREQQP